MDSLVSVATPSRSHNGEALHALSHITMLYYFMQCHAVLEVRMVRACSWVEIDVPSGKNIHVQLHR
jgi:hypothetical protein